MKYSFCIIACLVGITSVSAQYGKLTVGKKIQVVHFSKMNNKTTMMGTDVESNSNDSVFVDVEIKKVSDTAITLNSALRRITGKVSAMGKEQSFDSDDKKSTNNPLFSGFLKDLNKEETIVLVNGKLLNTKKDASSETEAFSKALGGVGNVSTAGITSQLFLPVQAINKPVGYKWTSEEKSEDGKINSVAIFTITKLSDAEIEITSNTSTSISGKIQAMGMEIEENVVGSTTSLVVYNSVTGLLIKGNQKNTTTGKGEVMGTTFPVNLQGDTNIFIK